MVDMQSFSAVSSFIGTYSKVILQVNLSTATDFDETCLALEVSTHQ